MRAAPNLEHGRMHMLGALVNERRPRVRLLEGTSQERAMLLDTLVDGFERNEALGGFRHRDLPMPNENAAIRKLRSLMEEASRWKGPPARLQEDGAHRIIAWPGLELRRVGRGIVVLARPPWFSAWWHARETWQGNPMGPIHVWLEEKRGAR